MRALIARAVRAAGHEVVGEAADFESALALLERATPDALIVDGRLPPNGIAGLIPRLLAAAPALRIYVLASLAERSLVRAAIASGAHGACLRPVREAAIVELLETGG